METAGGVPLRGRARTAATWNVAERAVAGDPERRLPARPEPRDVSGPAVVHGVVEDRSTPRSHCRSTLGPTS